MLYLPFRILASLKKKIIIKKKEDRLAKKKRRKLSAYKDIPLLLHSNKNDGKTWYNKNFSSILWARVVWFYNLRDSKRKTKLFLVWMWGKEKLYN